MAPPKIFVSHSHKDDVCTEKLVNDLRRAGADAWMDTTDLGAGNFQQRIDEALAGCEWFVLILTRDALASPWVQEEVYAAKRLKNLGRIRDLIFIRAGPINYVELPATWGVFNVFDVTHDYAAALSDVLRVLGLLEIRQLTQSAANIAPNSRASAMLADAGADRDAISLLQVATNFTFVLDHSASMKGAKLTAVKEAVKLIICRLKTIDIVSVVIFDDNAFVVIPAQTAADPVYLSSLVDRIKDGHAKRVMSLGMNAGLNEVRQSMTSAMVNRMILVTDGPTYGDADLCRRIAEDAGAAGIGIYPMGIGADWDEDLLDSIGQCSGGMPAEFIRRPEDALGLFERQLSDVELERLARVQKSDR
jgi:hypothetical protein